VDYMLYKTIILLFGEVIVSKSLLSSLKWEDTLSNVNAPQCKKYDRFKALRLSSTKSSHVLIIRIDRFYASFHCFFQMGSFGKFI
jgi:hypothetical protein